MSSIGKLMKQAARMQRQMEDVQAQMAARTVEGTSGGGAVKATARCNGTLAAIKIDPQALNPADVQLVEDMVLTAVNAALADADVKERFACLGAEPTGGTPQAFASMVKADNTKWKKIIADRKITVE